MKADLHSAYFWDCGERGTENQLRAIEADLDEPIAKVVSEHLIDPHFETIAEDDTTETEYIITRVSIAKPMVTCSNCGLTLETELQHN